MPLGNSINILHCVDEGGAFFHKSAPREIGIPAPKRKKGTDEAPVSSIDELCDLAEGKGVKAYVDAFEKTVAELTLLESPLRRDRRNFALKRLYSQALNLTASGIDRELTPYGQLDYSDLAIYLELTGGTNYTGLQHSRHIYDVLVEMLQSPRASLALKLALVKEYYEVLTVAEWVVTENGGVHIPQILEFVAEKNASDPDELPLTIPYGGGAFTTLIASAIHARRNIWTSNGSEIIAGLDASVVTQEYVTSLNSALWFYPYINNDRVRKALAVHARRLYDFDESIPDDWVLKALL